MKKALLFSFLFASMAVSSQTKLSDMLVTTSLAGESNPYWIYTRGGAHYAQLSGSYANPSQITAPAFSMITGTTGTPGITKFLQDNRTRQAIADSINPIAVSNIAALRANNYQVFVSRRESANDRPVIRVFGYYSANDGGGGEYYWDEACGAADDGAFYIKPASVAGNGRWRPLFNDNVINLKRMGCKGDGTFDNRTIIQAVIDAIPGNTANNTVLVLKAGTEGRNFYCSSTINLHTVTLQGGSLYGTILSFPAATIGVRMVKDTFGNYPCLKDIAVLANAKDPDDGYIDGVHARGISNDPNAYHYHGIYVNTVSRLDNVDVESFSGHGIRVYASVGDVPKTNASNFIIDRCRVRNMRGAGIYISGPDANQGVVTAVDVRDNGLCGIWDASFLGNQFFACMAHNNGLGGTVGGHYRATNLNARSTFVACYGEGDSQPSYIGPNATFIGGINENGVTGPGTILVNNKFNKIVVANQGTSNEGFSISADVVTRKVYQRWSDSLGGNWATMWSIDPKHVYWGQNFNLNVPGSFVWQMGGIGAEFNVGVNGNTPRKRTLYTPSHQFSSLYIGSKNFQTMTDTRSGNIFTTAFQYGDVIYKGSAHQNEIWSWRNISPGLSGYGAPASYTEGLTATTDGTQYVKLSGRSTFLLPGVAIVINGKTGVILDTMTISGKKYAFMDVIYPNNQAPAAITYATPTWQAYGYSTGLTADRPALGANDYGYRYYSTDENKWYTWSGVAWVADGSVGPLTLGSSQLRLRTNYTPTGTADKNGNTGDVSWDDNFIYVKTSKGWKRTALSTF